MVLQKDNTVFVEGRDGWWSNELRDKVEQIFVMGITLPKCDSFDFYREALAQPGHNSGKPVSLVFRGYVKDMVLIYKFKKAPDPNQTQVPRSN